MSTLEGIIAGLGIIALGCLYERAGNHDNFLLFVGIGLLIVFVSIGLED